MSSTTTRHRSRAGRARERLRQDARRVHPRPLAAAEQLGPLGDACSRRPATRRSRRAGRTTPRRSRRPTRTPRCSPTRPSARSPTTSREVIGRLDQEAGRDRALVRRPADADRRRPRPRRPPPSRSTRRRSAACCRCRSRRCARPRRCSATRPTATAPSRSPTSSSATASPTPSARTRPRSSTRPSPCRRPGAPLFQAATANLNPWTEAKVDTQEPRPRPAADHLGREGPHRAVGDRERRRTRSRSATTA